MASSIFPKLRNASQRPRVKARKTASRASTDAGKKPFFGGARTKQGRKPLLSD